MTTMPKRMVLDCPRCHRMHVDKGRWARTPHHKHLCAYCGNVWQAFEGDTYGVNPNAWRLYTHHLGPEANRYMRRWILQTPFGSVRLQNIRREDKERHLHDHPFWWLSFLLRGGYVEELVGGVFNVRRRFSFAARKATTLHRIVELHGDVWTLFVTGPRSRLWGFSTEAGWVDHDSYEALWGERL